MWIDQITIQEPFLLWFAVPLGLLALWLSLKSRSDLPPRRRAIVVIVRILIFALVLLALAKPETERTQSEIPKSGIVLVRDASESVRADREHALALADRVRQTLPKSLSVRQYTFAGASTEGTGTPGELMQSDIQAALDRVYRDTMDAPATQVILLTDGRETRGAAVDAARRLALRGGNVHVLPIGLALASPPRLLRIDTGIQNHVGVPVSFTVTLESSQPQQIQLRLADAENRTLDQREAKVDGKQCMVLQATPLETGVNHYQLELRTEGGNGPVRYNLVADAERVAVHVEGPPKILIVDPFPQELTMLQAALAPLKLEIETRTPEDLPANLGSYATLILSDLSGSEFTPAQRAAIASCVEEGAGLVFIGGGNAVPTRWKTNPLAELLPFGIQPPKPREPKAKPKVGICYVLDRSGSMGQPLGSNISKLDMVKASVAASLSDLPEEAVASVIVFDDRFDTIVPPTPIAQKDRILERIEAIQVGGGTAMAPGVGAAIDWLRAFQGQRYLVVLTDGQSAPPNGLPWESLGREASLNEIHWTSIAVGADADFKVMERLADAAGGAYFQCDSAEKIPKVFISQARDVRRKNANQRDPFKPQPGPAISQLKDITVTAIPELKDAIETSAKPGTDILLLGRNKAPLLASWRVGLGNVVGFASDAKNLWAEDWTKWNATPAFWSQLVQRCLRPPSKLQAKVASFETPDAIHYVFTVTDKDGIPADSLKCQGRILVPSGAASAPAPETIRVSSPQPGAYEAVVPVGEGGPARMLSVRLVDPQGGEIPYATMIKGRRPLETTFTGPDVSALQQIAQAGSGVFSSEPGAVVAACRPPQARVIHRVVPLWPYAIAGAVLLWIVDLSLRKFVPRVRATSVLLRSRG